MKRKKSTRKKKQTVESGYVGEQFSALCQGGGYTYGISITISVSLSLWATPNNCFCASSQCINHG